MKKIIFLLIFTLCTALIFSASYDNNQYSRKSRFYLSLAQRSFDSGDYEASAEYSRQAADYAAQSEAYIQKMVARSEAETLMNTARTRLTWAKSLNAEKFFPDVYSIAVDSIALGSDAFYAEDYALSKEYAQKALDALSNVRDVDPLPQYYVVRTWRDAKHCFWTIAGYPYVFDDSFQWRKLYEANKDKIPDPDNPNLILPGTVLTIPSLYGEYREGTFDPGKKYDPLIKN